MVKQVFLSHASADKKQYVIPFARKLDEAGISYWLDEAEIKWGEKISQKINEGLNKSFFVVIFLTTSFVGRNWTEAELSAALNRENDEGRVVVLPIVVGNPKEILASYPLLRDKSYQLWIDGLDTIVGNLKNLVFLSHSDVVEPTGGWINNKFDSKTKLIVEVADTWNSSTTLLQVWVNGISLQLVSGQQFGVTVKPGTHTIGWKNMRPNLFQSSDYFHGQVVVNENDIKIFRIDVGTIRHNPKFTII